MLTIRAMADGKGYSSRHLEHRDYYAEGERVIGQWQGRGAELLRLAGEVKTEDFEALRQGFDPQTGEFLRQRQSADRIASDGTTQSRGRSLYDFTISAPKSVSVMAILGGDNRLIEAHERAVAEALRELENHSATRVRKQRANEDRATGNLVMAVYHHDTSRELDPQLHIHAVAANLTYDGIEGRWKALQASGIYERRAYLAEVYRNSLAREVRSLGYEIENRRDGKGRNLGFELRGIPNEILTKFSQRSRQRDEAIRRFVAKNGRQPTDNEVAVLVRETRADKMIEISTSELRRRQRDRLTPDEARVLAEARRDRAVMAATNPAEPSLEYAKDHIFERVSVCRDHELLTEALRHGRGEISHQDLKGALALQESTGNVLRHRNEIATVDSLKRELEMINSVNRGVAIFQRLGETYRFSPSDRLNPEQKHVIEFVLGCRDRTVNISGAAGTGKTATLQELHRGICEAGQGVLAVAPTMSAVEELKKVGFADAVTIERLLQDQAIRSAMRGKVVIIDEAGMVSGRQMSELLLLSEQQSARLVFSGDTKQIQSVEACDALRILEKESRLKTVLLRQVRRQTVNEYREAIQELRRNPSLGFEKLDAIGAVREVPWLDRAEAVAVASREMASRGSAPLVVCATHDEIDRITEAIRSSRKRDGALAQGAVLTRDVALNWTTARKSDVRNLRAGHILGFHRAVKGIEKNESVEVGKVEGDRATVRNHDGESRIISAKHVKSFDVYERREIEVAAGDRLLLNANRREPGFRAINGEIVTAVRVGRHGAIHLQDGRVLPRNFRQFAYGYAVTAHRSQGKSVDSVIISADGMQKELFYVAASRGKENVLVITSDKERLHESITRSAARQSASELSRNMRPGLHQGIHRGLSAARKIATWVAQHLVPDLGRLLPQPEPAEPRPEAHRPEPQRVIRKEQNRDHGMER